MKIQSKDITHTGAVEKTAPARRNIASDFSDALLTAQRKISPKAAPQIGLPSTMQIPVISLNPVEQLGERSLASQIDDLLNLMEEYQGKMENPTISLKQIQPLIEKMDSETGRLLPILETLPETSEMKDILNRALVASSVEVIKFNRGDYL